MNLQDAWIQAIDTRTSRRTYLDQKLDQQTIEKLQTLVETCNKEGNLHIRFVEKGGEAFKNISSSYGMFHGVTSYFAMVGDKNMPHLKELVGYYGEAIVLQCVSMKLGTCWVSASYDKEICKKQIGLAETEELVCVIPVGYVSQEKAMKEKAISIFSKKKKPFDEFIDSEEILPAWVSAGVEAVMKAPSGMNKQPVVFTYHEGRIKSSVKNADSSQGIDLGIARLHFELGAIGSGCHGKWLQQDGSYLFCKETAE